MQLNELIKITNFEGRQVMYIDKMIVWITMRYTYIRKIKVLTAATANIKKLFVDEYQEPHAAISVNNDHLETIPIRSRRFRNYLSSVVYNDCEMVVDSQTLKDVIGLLSAKAEFGKDSEIIKLNLRVAESEDGSKWYYDLTNKNWEFIEITSSGWKIVNNLILFHRYNNQLLQVYPSKDYPADIFDRFIALVLNRKSRSKRG